MKKFYVYKTTNIQNGRYYIGVHQSECIQNDTYLGSGKILKLAIAQYGRTKFNREILFEFNSRQEAYLMQKKLVDKQLIKNPETYNLKCGGQGGMGGLVAVKDTYGNKLLVLPDDPRYISRQLKPVAFGLRRKNKIETLGRVTVKDKYGNTSKVSVNDPRYLSGQLQHVYKNRITVRDVEGNTFSVLKDDPRWLSGQLVGVIKGKYMWITNGNESKIIKKQQNIPLGWKKGRTIKQK